MDEGKTTLIFYRSWWDGMQLLDEETQLKLFRAIVEYQFDGREPEDGQTRAMFRMSMKTQLDMDSDKWTELKEKRRAAGKRHKGNQYTQYTKKGSGTNGTNGTSVPKMEHNGTNGTVDVDVDVDVDATHKMCVDIREKKNKGDFEFTKDHEKNMMQAYTWALEQKLEVTMADISGWYGYNEQVGWVTKAGLPIKMKKASLRCYLRSRKDNPTPEERKRKRNAENERERARQNTKVQQEIETMHRQAVKGDSFEEFRKNSGLKIFGNDTQGKN